MTLTDLSDSPINKFLNFNLLSHSKERAEISMPLKRDYIQETGVVHGGLISTAADTAAVYALYPNLPDGKTMTSVEFKVNFLRPALVENGDLTARAQVVKRGRQIGLCEVEVSQNNKLVAKGLFTYLILPKGN